MIVLWTQPGCGPCYAVKRAFANTPYVERNADEAPEAERKRWHDAGMVTPIVQYPGGEFSGFLPARVQSLVDARRV